MRLFLAIFASIALALAPAWAQAICTTSMQDGPAAEAAVVADGTSMNCEDRAPVEEGEADACLIAMTLVCVGALSVPEDSGAVDFLSTAGDKVVRLGSASVRSTVPDFDTPPPRV
ncbi:hypothetical protein [Parvularcula oceani]|uniref:hypothetical protein n=1 Tax=Parvularcula oceani TaxID=1247963 RepID=UPI0012DFC8C5|nr:hypothetical protein [Parvularcula oceani]